MSLPNLPSPLALVVEIMYDSDVAPSFRLTLATQRNRSGGSQKERPASLLWKLVCATSNQEARLMRPSRMRSRPCRPLADWSCDESQAAH